MRRIFVGLVLTFEDRMHSIRFFSACYQKEHMLRSVQQRRSEGQALWRRLGRGHRHDEALLLVQGCLVREE